MNNSSEDDLYGQQEQDNDEDGDDDTPNQPEECHPTLIVCRGQHPNENNRDAKDSYNNSDSSEDESDDDDEVATAAMAAQQQQKQKQNTLTVLKSKTRRRNEHLPCVGTSSYNTLHKKRTPSFP
jgi:archaellum component FlaD/FlaE